MEQLSSLSLVLRPTSPPDREVMSWSTGPYLQGALMERVDAEYASTLHRLPFNPYSQYCVWEGDALLWRVSALTREASARILDPLRGLERIEVRRANATFEVVKATQETLPVKALVDRVREAGPPRVRVRFATPTAFKSQGSYVIMPSVRLMLQNLLMHYGQVYDENKEGFAETVEYVDAHARISSYNLRSSYFDNVGGGRRIPAFVGTATVSLRGPDMACGLARMLLEFGEFAGVGVKTSMGMGGFTIL